MKKYKYIVAVWNEEEEYYVMTFDTYVSSFMFYRKKQHEDKWQAGCLIDNYHDEIYYSFEKKEGVYRDSPSLMDMFLNSCKNKRK